ncbi:Histone-lysine N-methyltransferase SETMAR, partial [Habropoda laboriosa]
YSNELEVVHRKLKVQQPALINRKGTILLHDNARLHRSSIKVLPHPPYFSDLSSTDYHFCRTFDNFLL